MRTEFSGANNTNFAVTPQIIKDNGKYQLALTEQGCTHFLVFISPLGENIDLQSEDLKSGVVSLGVELLQCNDTPLPGASSVSVICTDFLTYRKNNNRIDVPDRAACYTVCGCHYAKNEDVFRLLLPTGNMRASISASVEIRYRARPHYSEVKTGLFKKELQKTPFYEVLFEKKSAFRDGAVSYALDGLPYRFPITTQMLGKLILIKTDGKIPKFSAASGINLKDET